MPAKPKGTPRYHTQDTGYYCGAAVAMSLAEWIGAHYMEQDALNGIGRKTTLKAGAYTTDGVDPEGMQGLLNDRLADAGRPERCEVRRHGSPTDAARYLVQVLRTTGFPGALLGLNGAHWMLCVDTADAQWAPGQVGYLCILDPVPYVPDGEKPFHGPADACGSTPELGADQQWECTPWREALLPVGGVYPTVAVPPPAGAPEPVLAGGAPLVEAAVPPILLSALSHTAAALGVSLHVQTPALDDVGYDLRPMVAPDGMHGLARYRQGVLQGFIRLSGPTALPSDVQLVAEALSFAGLPVATGLVIDAQFTWQMCEESQSPYLPFRQVRVPGTEISFFVRIDGRFFWRPTPLRAIG